MPQRGAAGPIKCTSSNPSVVSADSNVLIAEKAGKAKITVKSGKRKLTRNIVVKNFKNDRSALSAVYENTGIYLIKQLDRFVSKGIPSWKGKIRFIWDFSDFQCGICRTKINVSSKQESFGYFAF